MAKKSKDGGEFVDGPAAAAKILNHMSADNRERILNRITKVDERLAEQIEDNLSSFDDILDLTPRSVQKLILSIDHDDLVLALKLASEDAKNFLYENMSDRKRSQVKDDLNSLAPMHIAQIQDAQQRILNTLDRLRTQGLLHSKAKNDIYV